MVHAPKFFQTMFLDIEVIEHLPILLVLIDFSLEVTLEPIESISENWMKIKKVSANHKRTGPTPTSRMQDSEWLIKT